MNTGDAFTGLDADQWAETLVALADELPVGCPTVTLVAYGGVAVALGYGCRRTTKDFDVVFDPLTEPLVLPVAVKIAAARKLPTNRLNDAAYRQGFVAGPAQGEEQRVLFRRGALVVLLPTWQRLLASKVQRFAGQSDREDTLAILREIAPSFGSWEDVWSHIGGFIKQGRHATARANLEFVWGDYEDAR